MAESIRITVVAEDRPDFQIANSLADRVVVENVDWTDGNLPQLRTWQGLEPGKVFTKWSALRRLSERAGRRIRTQIKKEGATRQEARKAVLLALQMEPDNPPDLVLLVRDTDNDSRRRSSFLDVAQDASLGTRVLIAMPHTKREAWVLASFEASPGDEHRKLEQERGRLGFNPTSQPEKLTAQAPNSKREAKKALSALTGGDLERERRCWEETPLPTLSARGNKCGLTDYFIAVSDRLVPLFKKA